MAAREDMAALLPDEPQPGADSMTLLIRLPGGERLTRRFLYTDKTTVNFY